MTSGFGCFVRIDWGAIVQESFGYCVTSMAGRARADSKRRAPQQTGVVRYWRSSSQVKLREEVWHTAPNHSRPASCVIDADMDAEIIQRAIHKRDIEGVA